MSIRIPTNTVITAVDTGNLGATSVAGGSAFPFILPQDVDNVMLKLTASISGGGVSAIFQTSDDGGSTFYDVARTSVISRATNQDAQWLSIPVISPGINPAVTLFGASIIGATIGSAAASTLGSRQVSGLPILGTQNRVFFVYTGNITASSLVQAVVKANNQASANG